MAVFSFVGSFNKYKIIVEIEILYFSNVDS